MLVLLKQNPIFYRFRYIYNKEDMIMATKKTIETKNDLKEFEDELKKHKDKITPGQVGES